MPADRRRLKTFERKAVFLAAVAALGSIRPAMAQLAAFPGAEGFGGTITGGRSGGILHVNTLSDANSGTYNAATGIGTGSFRWATGAATSSLTLTTPRTVVFDTSGMITLNSNLRMGASNMTIAGQTAPGPGITIRGWESALGGSTTTSFTTNTIIRYLRFRPGDINGTRALGTTGFQGDSFHFRFITNAIADHISTSWSIDENLSASNLDNVTIQNSIIAEALRDAGHLNDTNTGTELHSFGMLLGSTGGTFGGQLSIHHNLFASNDSRNPRVGNDNRVDFVNNVSYNWGGRVAYSGGATEGTPQMNYVNNYLVAGPSTQSGHSYEAFYGGSTNTQIYQSGNLIDGDKNGVLNGTDTGETMFTIAGGTQTFVGSRFNFPLLTTSDATTAFNQVTAYAGASNIRDANDSRIVNYVLSNGTAGLIINSQNDVGGYPSIPLNTRPANWDTDGDGMPDYWEYDRGSNPASVDQNIVTGTGYTRVEDHLNGIASASTWAVNADGDWSPGGNWYNGSPNGSLSIAQFGYGVTAPRTITNSTPHTVGIITFDNSSFTVTGPGTLTLDTNVGNAAINILSGSHTIATPLNLADNLNLVILPANSLLTLSGQVNATGRTITKLGAGAVQMENVRAGGLNISAGSFKISPKAQLNDLTGTSIVQALTLSPGTQLDLTNNAMVIDYSGSSAGLLPTLLGHIQSGRLISSSADASLRLGYVDNIGLGRTDFAGQPVDSDSLLIGLATPGDADLSGAVDVADLTRLALAWQAGGYWFNGDFNYDGFVDIKDLMLLAENWNGSQPPLQPALTSLGLPTSLPEPASIGCLALAGVLSTRRRRS